MAASNNAITGPPPGSRTALSGYVRSIVHAITDFGIDVYALMDEIGIDHSQLENFHYRYSQDQVTKLWKAAIKATGDPNFGLKVAKHIRPSSYHVVGHAMLCSNSLSSAARRFARFAKLVSDSAVVNYSEEETYCRLDISLETDGAQPAYQAFDTVLAGFLEYCRWILDGELVPAEVFFTHPPPKKLREYQALFQCRVRYGQSTNAILFHSTDMGRSIPGANEELASLLDELATRYMAERYQGRFSRRVRELLLVKLPDGEPSRTTIAQQLHMTERTLARRLSEENTTFYEILKQVREELAYGYLKYKDISIEEIASLLGFSDRGTFSRAFKSWTGKRPTEWRTDQSHFQAHELVDRDP